MEVVDCGKRQAVESVEYTMAHEMVARRRIVHEEGVDLSFPGCLDNPGVIGVELKMELRVFLKGKPYQGTSFLSSHNKGSEVA